MTSPNSRAGQNKRNRDQIIAALRASGGIISIAAQKLGVHRQRVHEWVKKDQKLEQEVVDIRNEVLDLAEAKLLEHIRNGSEKSIHFYLKTIGRDRGFNEKVVVAGSPGEPIGIEPVTIFQLPDNGR